MNRQQRRAAKSNKKGKSLGRPESSGSLIKQIVRKNNI